MLPSSSLIDSFEDCVNRIALGQSIESCLELYPDQASRLRSLLENAETIKAMRAPQAEEAEDQALVWQQIMQAAPMAVPRRRRGRGYRIGLLAAVLIFLVLMGTTWLVLTRPDNNLIVPSTETPTHTPSATTTASMTATPTLTQTPTTTPTLSLTPSLTATPTQTISATPSRTATITASHTLTTTPSPAPTRLPGSTASPSATFAAGCGAPLTEQDAINRVLAIYPNTTITRTRQDVRFGDRLVWVVETSHRIEVTIDVACGDILTIEQMGGGGSDNSNDNDNLNSNSNSNGSGNQNDNSNQNSSDNQNSNDNSDDSGGMGSDDNSSGSGMGDD
jgi:hypothetical protein